MKTLIAALAVACTLTVPVSAEERLLVAIHTHFATPDDYTMIFELGNVMADPEACQGFKGVRMAQVSASTPKMFPRLIPYGTGCWFPTKDGNVIVSFRRFNDGQTIERSIPQSKFVTTVNFKKWDDFQPASLSPTPPKAVQDMIAQVDKLAFQCRDGDRRDAKTVDACGQVQPTIQKVKQMYGWCVNLKSDVVWERCR